MASTDSKTLEERVQKLEEQVTQMTNILVGQAETIQCQHTGMEVLLRGQHAHGSLLESLLESLMARLEKLEAAASK